MLFRWNTLNRRVRTIEGSIGSDCGTKELSAYFGFRQGLYCSFLGQKGRYGKNSESCNILSDAEKCDTGPENACFWACFTCFSGLYGVGPQQVIDIKIITCLFWLKKGRYRREEAYGKSKMTLCSRACLASDASLPQERISAEICKGSSPLDELALQSQEAVRTYGIGLYGDIKSYTPARL